jgi:hypothetical protein
LGGVPASATAQVSEPPASICRDRREYGRRNVVMKPISLKPFACFEHFDGVSAGWSALALVRCAQTQVTLTGLVEMVAVSA